MTRESCQKINEPKSKQLPRKTDNLDGYHNSEN